MGLAAPKRRNKLSHDPNNTGWSNSVDSYGQKILSAQGWKPGDYLGARDASHAEHYTAANKSHIKILLREDNLGLGAQVGKRNAETFGLSLYSGVLSRLNGKSDVEVEKQQSALRDAELRTYQANKYGFMNFVSGGVLVGDSIKREDTDAAKRSTKKRKLDDVEAEGAHRSHRPEQSQETGETSVEHLKIDDSSAESSEAHTVKKKSRRKDKDSSAKEQRITDSDLDKRERKQLKRARKEERRKRKEEKRKAKFEKKLKIEEEPQSSDETQPEPNRIAASGSRHAVRHRYIHQKRMASLDPKAMREIFMVKAGA